MGSEDEPLVTIGLCVKNAANTVAWTIRTIVSQSYDNVELIVVDGMSTDGTLDIIKRELSQLNIPARIESDNGKGLAYARQLVVDYAKGKYVLWVDGDHILPHDYVKKQVIFMENHSDAGAAEAITRHIGSSLVAKLEGYIWRIYSKKRVGKNLESVGSAGTIYRLEAIKEVGGYDIRIRGAGEDGDISRRIKKKGWSLYINPDAYYYHVVRSTWRDLWREYYWWGYGAHYVAHKHPYSVNPWKFIPLIAFISGVKHGLEALKQTNDLTCLLMPIHYAWKRTAWTIGWIKAHYDRYGHDQGVVS
ncbi:MAG: glycosyltransferase [Candidatus Bathyarchaeia archaeon]